MKYSNDDYREMEVKDLGFEDALEDENFNKKPGDIMEYCGFNDSFMRSIPDFQDDELITFIRAMGAYYTDGIEPDYESIKSTAVKMALRGNITSHDKRIEAKYVQAYQSFVKGKKRRKS